MAQRDELLNALASTTNGSNANGSNADGSNAITTPSSADGSNAIADSPHREGSPAPHSSDKGESAAALEPLALEPLGESEDETRQLRAEIARLQEALRMSSPHLQAAKAALEHANAHIQSQDGDMAEQDTLLAAASETERSLTASLAEARVQVESFLQKLSYV